MTGLCIPYEQVSRPGVGKQPCVCEVVSRWAFRRSVESGRSLRTGKPIFACWGHKRNGRKRWRIASTEDHLKLWEREDGVYFQIDGVKLPIDFTGVSVRLEALAWKREADLLWRLKTGGIRHVAILLGEEPAYNATFMATIRASSGRSFQELPA